MVWLHLLFEWASYIYVALRCMDTMVSEVMGDKHISRRQQPTSSTEHVSRVHINLVLETISTSRLSRGAQAGTSVRTDQMNRTAGVNYTQIRAWS